jgi:hypothetical protein
VPQREKIVGETDIPVMVTPPGKGLKSRSGMPGVLSETEDPTLRFEVSFT